jgi:hypothetical protein
MNALQQQVLAGKRAWIDSQKPTIQPEANLQTGSTKPWQAISPGGRAQIPYPELGELAVILCQYQVPAGMSGALKKIAIVHNGAAGSFVDNSGTAAWHMTLNNAAVPGYETILSQLGSFEIPIDVYLLLQENDVLAIWVQGPVYDTGAPAPPVGFPAALMTGYLAFGGQGTYYNPSGSGNAPHHHAGVSHRRR